MQSCSQVEGRYAGSGEWFVICANEGDRWVVEGRNASYSCWPGQTVALYKGVAIGHRRWKGRIVREGKWG